MLRILKLTYITLFPGLFLLLPYILLNLLSNEF
jgi:hypothetical protein